MIIETILSTVVGGAFRLAPEVLKWLDRKDERKHEVLMLEKQNEFEKMKAEYAQKLAETQAEERITVTDIQAIVEATKAQAQQTGIKFVDGFNALIRPLLAFQWLICLWPSILVATFVLSVMDGTPALKALSVFGEDEKSLAMSIAAFWLVDRALRKTNK